MPATYQVDLYPNGLQYMAAPEKLASRPYFYEIRSQLYQFVLTLDIDFNDAFFEFEGADHLKDSDVAADINLYGIGNHEMGDQQAATLSIFEPSYYYGKRYFDGLVISEALYDRLIRDREHFVIFKPGYFWLPIPI
jgi:hypothetical protein